MYICTCIIIITKYIITTIASVFFLPQKLKTRVKKESSGNIWTEKVQIIDYKILNTQFVTVMSEVILQIAANTIKSAEASNKVPLVDVRLWGY